MDVPDVAAPSPPGAKSRLNQWLGGRRGLILAGTALAGGGLALNWSWLTAIGVAPIILSLAPCAAMCALGWCVMGRGMSGRPSCAEPGRGTNADSPAMEK